jgi:hypothetical protein
MHFHRLFGLALLLSATVQAAGIPYQGLLTDANNNPVADGSVSATFALYRSASTSKSMWTEIQNVSTRKGLFSVVLGTTTALPDSVFDKDSLYLGLTWTGTTEMTPRTLIVPAALAGRARSADTAKYALDLKGIGVKVDSAALTKRLGDYATTASLASYATTASLTAYATTTSVNNLTTTVAGKANQTDVNALTTTVGKKADTSWVRNNFPKYTVDATDDTRHLQVGGPYPNIQAGNTTVTSGSIHFMLDTTVAQYLPPEWSISVATDGLHFGKYSGGPSTTYDYFTLDPNGSLLSSALTVTRKLNVNDSVIVGKNLRVGGTIYVGTTAMSVPDYVFEPDYKLASLSEVESYTQANKHLPDVPSASELEQGGIDMAKMNLVLLRKVEELTLHAIEQQKRIEALEERLK